MKEMEEAKEKAEQNKKSIKEARDRNQVFYDEYGI